MDEVANRRLFYSLVHTRSRNPLAPLVLWFQGGPGCSPMGAGFWQELGPFILKGGRPGGGGEVVIPNNHTWANFANLLFIESPVNTGFSTSDDPSDHKQDDASVTRDHVDFLQRFLKRHAYLSRAEVFLAGESYAGHYIPLMASKLIHDGLVGRREGQINLRGLVPINPWSDTFHDNLGAVNWWFGQGVISAKIRDSLLGPSCNLANGALWRTSGPNGLSPKCNAIRDSVSFEFRISLYGSWTLSQL